MKFKPLLQTVFQGGARSLLDVFGSIELFVTGKIGLGVKYKLQQSISVLNSNAGFFPNDFEYAKRFADLMISSMQVNDALVFGICLSRTMRYGIGLIRILS